MNTLLTLHSHSTHDVFMCSTVVYSQCVHIRSTVVYSQCIPMVSEDPGESTESAESASDDVVSNLLPLKPGRPSRVEGHLFTLHKFGTAGTPKYYERVAVNCPFRSGIAMNSDCIAF